METCRSNLEEPEVFCLRENDIKSYVGRTIWIADGEYNGSNGRNFFGVVFKPVIIEDLGQGVDLISCTEISGKKLIIQVCRQAIIFG